MQTVRESGPGPSAVSSTLLPAVLSPSQAQAESIAGEKSEKSAFYILSVPITFWESCIRAMDSNYKNGNKNQEIMNSVKL